MAAAATRAASGPPPPPPPVTGRPQAAPPTGVPAPVVTLDAARKAATRMRETFGLSIFGFDLIIDGVTGEALVIDVNYFPSFKDLSDFPQVLRKLPELDLYLGF